MPPPPDSDIGNTPICGKILIVDDDPMVAGMLDVTLTAAGHDVSEVHSGEQALSLIEGLNKDARPDIVILDIELGSSMDGYQVCRTMRLNKELRNIPVIFLSGHDELDDRLRAYDAGGDDFMAKPFDPDELMRKANLSIRHKRRQELVSTKVKAASETAMVAMSALGETGVTLRFSRGALACHTLRALANLMIESMQAFGVDCQVQLRSPHEKLTLTPHGPASPLEESVVEKLQTMERIFSFKNRMIVNYESVSLLVSNMPVDNPELCGRIRDEAAMITESAELAVANINLRTDSIARTNDLRTLAEASRRAVETLRESYRKQELASRIELEKMAGTVEDMYIHLGLTDRQEHYITDAVRGAADRVLMLFENAHELDQAFAAIVDDLSKAAAHTTQQEEPPAPAIELW